MSSGFLSARQLKGLARVGQTFIPGGGGFPSFEASGCVAHSDRMLATMPELDLKDLKLLLTLFGLMPDFLARTLVLFIDVWAPTRFAPGVARLIRIGLRGVAFTLYYGDPGVLKALGYSVNVPSI